jgi:hypothetical protein
MDQPIIVRFRWSVDDLIEGYRCYFRHTCRPIIRVGLHFIVAILSIGGILALLHYYGVLHYAGYQLNSPLIPIGFVVVGFYWFIVRRFDFRRTLRRRYAKRPDRDSEIEWQITPDKLSTRDRVAYSEFSWEALAKIVRTPSGLMFYYFFGPVWSYLPRRGFTNNAEFEQLVDLAKSKVRKFYNVT